MALVTDAPERLPVLPRARRAPLRLFLLGRATIVMLTSMVGVVLFSLWITLVAIAPITIFAPLLLPMTAVVRWYADLHRRDAQNLLGTRVDSYYREPQRPTVLGRVAGILRDRASWRDAAWLLLHGVVACFTAAWTFALFFGAVFYLIYPFLFWVTPEKVFNHPFGGLVHLHSVGASTAMMPLALVLFGLWYVLAIPLVRAELSVTKSLLRRSQLPPDAPGPPVG